MADPDERIFINELVCEGCGDCGVQSNCVAIQPIETEFGRKRRIDPSACNKDLSCIRGFCPAFVTVRGARTRSTRMAAAVTTDDLPEPAIARLDRPYGILVTGIGGTGVVTVGALLGMAAHLEGKGTAGLDMIGLAQKGGAVVTHLKLAPTPAQTGAPRLTTGEADCVLACDMIVAAGRASIPHMAAGRTRVVLNAQETMTGAFTADPDLRLPADRLREAVITAVGEGSVDIVDASRLAERLLGDTIGANLLMVGFAWQKGWLPLSQASILGAIAVNGVAVSMNQEAFAWGRRAAHDLDAVLASAGLAEPESPPTLDQTIEHRAAFLRDYQDEAYADRYRALVQAARAAEARLDRDSSALAEAVADALFRLMAIKDEYEVARLYSDGAFERQLRGELESWQCLELHLAPPLLAPRDPRSGRLQKRQYGPWILRLLPWIARMRRLRGTRLDLFGMTAERRMERRLLSDYETMLRSLLDGLDDSNIDTVTELAGLPVNVRGFGHVKARHVEIYEHRRSELLARLDETDEKVAATV